MKGKLAPTLLALALLTGCGTSGLDTTSPDKIMSTAPSLLDACREVYNQFLLPDSRSSREAARERETGSPSVEEYYSIYDVDGDQIPELILCYWELGRYYVDLYAFRESTPTLLGTYCIGRNGPFLYVCPQEAAFLADLTLYGPGGTSHTWRKFTLKGDTLSEEELLYELIPWEEEGSEPTLAHTPTEATALVPDAYPLELTAFYPPLDPWQEAYRDILLHPEEYEEFYAVAQHIPSDQSKLVTYYQGITPYTYAFAMCDINADGTAELLLQGTSPRVLLNILRYNAETDTVEDMDGPRTYPLMDGLYVYENGYLWTQNGAGGLYTECWRLEDEDPEHYWYGFERPWDASYDGPRSTDDIHFRDSDGGELGYWEFYALLGEPVSHIEWQEATPYNIEKAFLPPAREEAP